MVPWRGISHDAVWVTVSACAWACTGPGRSRRPRSRCPTDRLTCGTRGSPRVVLPRERASHVLAHARGGVEQAFAIRGLHSVSCSIRLSFLAPVAQNEPGLSSGLAEIGRLADHIVSRGIRTDHIVLMGFSQGACLASEFAVRDATRYGGVLVFSGGLIGPLGTTWTYPGSFNGTPVFLGCSVVDSHIPRARVEESADVFRRMGANVTMRLYPGFGHVVNDDEIAAAQAMLDALVERA
jgi:predicted esterase